MSLYYPTRQPTIAPNIIVRKQRRLPVAGDILVRIGSARGAGRHRGARQISPARRHGRHRRAAGGQAEGRATPAGPPRRQHVRGGRRAGLAPPGAQPSGSAVKSPVAGTLTGYDAATGQATVTPASTNFELQAYIDGVVTEHLPYRGVVIDTPAAVVRGIVGVGGERHGVLQVAVADPAEELMPDQITARYAYAIVLGGGTTTAAKRCAAPWNTTSAR